MADRDVMGAPLVLRDVDLDTFFHPRTVAVIGASDTPKRPYTSMTNKIRAWAEAHGATVYPVNPRRETVGGLRCYPSIHDVPGPVDLAAVLVGDPMAVLDDLIDAGVRFAVVFAAGFAEVGPEGERLQAALTERIAASDTRVLGPNTNLNAFELFRTGNPGRGVALITQSGHQGRPIFQAQELGLNLTHWAPTGNEADLEFADFAGYFADHPEVGVIAAYVEGFKDGRTFQLAADRALRTRTPIVCIKVGRTAEGRAMARSHTGHLTGADEVVSAVFRQYGVVRVDGLDELQDTAMLFSRAAPPRGDGVCIYAISGGTGAHVADMAAAAGLRLPRLEPATVAELRRYIPDYLRCDNPVDSGGPPSGDPVAGRAILEAIVADPNVAVVIVPITGVVPSMSGQMARDLVAVAETTDKPLCVIWGSPLGTEEAYTDILLPSPLPVFRTFGNCIRAVKAYLDYYAFAERYRSGFDDPPLEPSPAATTARRLLAGRPALSEREAKELLAAYGIPLLPERLVEDPEEAVRAAEALGLPVALKVSSPDLPHRSELGLVRLDLRTPEEVRAAAAGLLRRVAEVAPQAAVEGLLVAPMVSDGVETVVGVARDELFGPVVMFGLGGLWVEVLRDVTFRVPPFPREDAQRMCSELRGSALLRGVRGRPPVDTEALVDTIMAVQRLACDLASEVAELDINPLIARPDGVVAVDALVVPDVAR